MTRLSEAVERARAAVAPTAGTIDYDVQVDAGDLNLILDALDQRTAALNMFMGYDARFIVSIGGNPIAVERFLTAAAQTLEEQ